jgi:2-succinyl-5-enolpyruvyl-6-hydroxy-3-cyclohexene-1-carboxylate synthase
VNTKQSVLDLVNVCYEKDVRKVVFSPGSRNAPLIIAFNEHGGFETFSIPDERVAAFFALGMAQQTDETVALVSTSGSAALNYAPALAEAYYQRIPMLAITADRPPEWIDQGNGQTMRQRNLFKNYIKNSFEINLETTHEDELWYNVRIFNEAINETQIEPKGPVHINFPLREPLYDFEIDFEPKEHFKIIDQFSPPPELSSELLSELAEIWNKSRKKLILCGITKKSQHLNHLLSSLSNDPSIVVLTETTSNLSDPGFIEQIDRVIFSMKTEDFDTYQPDLLLTFGTNIVSKKIKFLLRKWQINEHWHIDETDIVIDTFKSLTKHLRCDLVHFFSAMLQKNNPASSDYRKFWQLRNERLKKVHASFKQNTQWSDFKAYSICLDRIPMNTQLQMANSAAVRYVQLMEQRPDLSYYCNRGVAGIDGCTSTATGAAFTYKDFTVLVTGDIAFLYDSNALWHSYISEKLRIIVFNNEGGNIFRIIPGPSSTNQLETFFEAHHNTQARYLAKAYGLNYFSAANEDELNEQLDQFYGEMKNKQAAILEIFTPRKINDQILKAYFELMK